MPGDKHSLLTETVFARMLTGQSPPVDLGPLEVSTLLSTTCAGLTNGDLFSKIIAFSPGGLFSPAATGQPAVFLSGGTSDSLFPIAQAERPAACQLAAAMRCLPVWPHRPWAGFWGRRP